MENIIPNVPTHELTLTTEGTGSKNNKEYCNCEKCKALRKRRDKIYNSFKYKVYRFFSLN